MSDAAELVRLIKRAALEAVEAEKPAAVCFGRVVSAAPLKISVEQRLTLGENQLILTEAVKNHYADVYFSGFTNTDAFMNAAHSHIISKAEGGGEGGSRSDAASGNREDISGNCEDISGNREDISENREDILGNREGGSENEHEELTCDGGNLDTRHRHGFSGRKRIMIYNGLREGEKVILLRAEGGQRFIVIDRLCDAATEGEWVE